jgi:PilZ domain
MDRRLREHQTVTISLPSSGAPFRLRDFEATVVALLEYTGALRPIDVDAGLIPSRTEDVFLSFVRERRLVGLKGVLTRNGADVRFRVQDGVRVPQPRQTRVDLRTPVSLRRADGESGGGSTVNISADGLLVRAPLAVTVGEPLDLSLTLPGHNHALGLHARVVRHGAGMIAIELAGGPPHARAAISELVVERRLAEPSAAS